MNQNWVTCATVVKISPWLCSFESFPRHNIAVMHSLRSPADVYMEDFAFHFDSKLPQIVSMISLVNCGKCKYSSESCELQEHKAAN